MERCETGAAYATGRGDTGAFDGMRGAAAAQSERRMRDFFRMMAGTSRSGVAV